MAVGIFKTFILSILAMPFLIKAAQAAETDIEASYLVPLGSATRHEFTSDVTGTARITFINIIPSRFADYDIAFSSEAVNPDQLPRPAATAEPDDSSGGGASAVSGISLCDQLVLDVQAVERLTDERDVASALEGMNQRVRALQASGMTCDANGRNYLDLASTYTRNSLRSWDIAVEEGNKTTITLYLDGVPKSIVILVPRKQFLTHVGFTLVDDKSQDYFSRAVPGSNGSPTTYAIQRKNTDRDWAYMATATYTYVGGSLGWKFPPAVEWGLTAGLSAGDSNLAVLVGPSLIIDKNILLNMGLSFREFSVLNGTYETGQNIGETAIDSSALSEETYKPTFMITIGFRLGD